MDLGDDIAKKAQIRVKLDICGLHPKVPANEEPGMTHQGQLLI